MRMNYTKAHIVTLAISICFAQGYLRAADERPRSNKFKVLAAFGLSIGGTIALYPRSTAALEGENAGRSFAQGVIVCSSLIEGGFSGAYAGSLATHDNSAGVVVGSMFGAVLTLTPAIVCGAAADFRRPKTTLNSIAQMAGCCCGSASSIAIMNAVLNH